MTEAKSRFSELLRLVQEGEQVSITRKGRTIAQLVSTLAKSRVVRFGTMRGKIVLKPGWDKPIDEAQFLSGDF